jgi:class 3 adenylate cyclase/pimeloyl-ACP methyl ester carboxylesterase
MRFCPPVSFAPDPKGSMLAYQVIGSGNLDLVFLLGPPSHLALLWEQPAVAEFLEGLASFSRVILFDPVGCGMSDRGAQGYVFEDLVEGISTVLSAVGSQRAALFGVHLGGRMALLFAATRPEKTAAVVTFGAHPATLRADDYPWGATVEENEALVRRCRRGLLDPDEYFPDMAPSEVSDPATRRWWSTFWLSGGSPVELAEVLSVIVPADIRGLLGSVRVPTLVLHRAGDRIALAAASKYMADRLPQATFHELPGNDHLPFFGDQEAVLALTQEFLTGSLPTSDADRVVLTVMFTDIVGSTERAAELGDRKWRRMLEEHDAVVRGNLARFRGHEVETTGDGFLVTFEGPARAIRSAAAMRDQLAEMGLRIRVGMHTGECELVGGHIRGIAVHIAARVLSFAHGDELLCSRTVKDLVAGAGFRFTDRGSHRLKGVPDRWPLYSVEPTAP